MKHSTTAIDYDLLTITSPAFLQDDFIPVQYTCDGADINPPLQIVGIPAAAKHLAIIVDDPDAPRGTWVHWVAWNLPVAETIPEHTQLGAEGRNDFGKHQYNGPCPPSGTHHYHFKVYALDETLYLPVSSNKAELERAMAGHILAFGELIGLYKRQ
jgi:Raf kinase inhibitor-like YbhB/YbcL family protein